MIMMIYMYGFVIYFLVVSAEVQLAINNIDNKQVHSKCLPASDRIGVFVRRCDVCVCVCVSEVCSEIKKLRMLPLI